MFFKVTKQKKPGKFLKSAYGYFFGNPFFEVYGITASGHIFREQYSGDRIEAAAKFFADFTENQPAPVYVLGSGKYASYTFNPANFESATA